MSQRKIQGNPELRKIKRGPSTVLYDKLTQLKLDILEDSSLFQMEEFQDLYTQIWEAELTEANRLRSFSEVKWLGTSNEPKKLFFALLKAKQ